MANEIEQAKATRFEAALRRFDEENSQDPNVQLFNGKSYPRELLYAQWLTEWLLKLCPGASEELRLAARCQHLCRWAIPRSSYPATRAGYLRWREELKRFHAAKASEILQEVGYNKEAIERVRALNLKTLFPQDPEARVLEDALCLVFLEYQLAELAAKTPEEKVVSALRKSWTKMTKAAQQIASELPYGTAERRLVEKALNSPP